MNLFRRLTPAGALAVLILVASLTGCSGGDGFSIDDSTLCAVPTVLQVHGPAEAARDIRENINVKNLQSRALKRIGQQADRLAASYLADRSPGREQALVAALGEIKAKCDAR